MEKVRFEELEKRNTGNPLQLCYEVFCEEKQQIPLHQFNQLFTAWLQLFKGGDIQSAIEYFKKHKLKL